MHPKDYSARIPYRATGGLHRRVNNWLGVPLTWLGLAPRDAVTLEVRGRRSGKPRRTPILRTRFRGDDYLVALAGEADWVRNARAASGRAVIHRRGAAHVVLEELPVADRAPVIEEYLRQGRQRSGEATGAKQAQWYFGLGQEPSFEQVTEIAEFYPVFRIHYR